MSPVKNLAPALLIALMLGLTAPASALANNLYSISDLTIIERAAPDFPGAALRAGIDGWVVLEFTVDLNGRVTDVEIADSSSRVFHRNATAALSKWRFEPVTENGEKVPARATVRFTFAGQ